MKNEDIWEFVEFNYIEIKLKTYETCPKYVTKMAEVSSDFVILIGT